MQNQIKERVMSEASARFWSTVFAGVTAIGLVLGGGYTVLQYFDARAKDRDAAKEAHNKELEAKGKEAQTFSLQVATAQLEARKPYYSKHLDLCSEATIAASTIVTAADPQRKKTATDDFWRLYWGPLSMVEGQEVEAAMVAFGDCLHGKCNHQSPLQLSLSLAHSCRSEVSRHFDLNLPTLEKKSSSVGLQ